MAILPGVSEHFEKKGDPIRPCRACGAACAEVECSCVRDCFQCEGASVIPHECDCDMCDQTDEDCDECDGNGFEFDPTCPLCGGSGVAMACQIPDGEDDEAEGNP